MVNPATAGTGGESGERRMSERKKFITLFILLIVSIVLFLYVRGNFGRDFVDSL